ncbi:MAG: inositol monophosphatase family protein [Anaerolineales bacterium]|jgi:myo-inositol-1(or 4)-monophosphatase
MSNTLTFITRLAHQAGAVLVAHYDRTGTRAEIKADQTFVTEADLAADQLISNAISESFPKDNLISEELNPIYNENMRWTWVVDPLDGTTNFALGLHYWGVSIARLNNNNIDVAALYFPMLDELFTAQRGNGAFLNGNPLNVNEIKRADQKSFFTCCSRTHRNFNISVPYKTRILGSAAYGFCSIARGSSLLAFEVTPKIWDLAASWLVVEEAGGVIEPYQQPSPFPLLPGHDYSLISYPTLAAINPELVKKGRKWITPKEG